MRDLVLESLSTKRKEGFLPAVETWISLGACTELDNMLLKKKNILVTGLPGIGKTTLIKDLSLKLRRYRPCGFYTEELRKGGVRRGFELISLDGARMTLAHQNIETAYRVGKYKVDVEGFEIFLLTVNFLEPEGGLIIIDEIGKMECLSRKFKEMIKRVLDSEKMVVATIALKAGGFIGDIRKREDVKLFEMTKANRDSLFPEIFDEVEKLLP